MHIGYDSEHSDKYIPLSKRDKAYINTIAKLWENYNAR
jgi:hypothetical protein